MDEVKSPLVTLQKRWGADWLMGAGAANFWPSLVDFQQQFQARQPRDTLLVDPNPGRFLAAVLAASQQPGRLWLTNPRWGQQEWQQVAAQCQPDWVIGPMPVVLQQQRQPEIAATPSPSAPDPQILIPTGGSSGAIRFAIHTWATLAASVQGFQQRFQCSTVNAYCVLPLFHVSGLMQAVRCWLSGGRLIVQSFSTLQQTGAIATPPPPAFLSLVPTQLQRLLQGSPATIAWLQQFTAILLGGAPPWPGLVQTARDQALPLALTYGMTETASQIATLLPSEFLAGQTSSGRPLPHACLSICDPAGRPLPPGHSGRITIAATSLAQGYWHQPLPTPFQSGDLGYLDEAGYLQVLGRETTLIMTGGEKVLPEEVEAALLQTGRVQDVAVLGLPDDDWGERVVAVVVPSEASESGDALAAVLRPLLSPYKIPKQWVCCHQLPRGPQGKLNRVQLQRWLMAQQRLPDAATGSGQSVGDVAAE